MSSKHTKIWALISSLVETVVAEAQLKAEERERESPRAEERESPSYRKGQLHADLQLLRTTTAMMRQLILIEGVSELIEACYYGDPLRSMSTSRQVEEASKQVEKMLKILQHLTTTFSDTE